MITDIDIYSFVVHDIIDLLESFITVEEVSDYEASEQIRLEDTVFLLTEDLNRVTAAVTAHNLEEYRNPLYRIKLTQDVKCWLDAILFQ